MRFENFDLEHIILNVFFSSLLSFVMFIITNIVCLYLFHININGEPIGILVLIIYFIVPYIAIDILFKGYNNDLWFIRFRLIRDI